MSNPIYTIGSEKGYNIVNQLQAGQSTNNLAQEYRPTDGSVWTKQQDGTISVMHNGQQMTGQVTYQPQTAPSAGSGGSTGGATGGSSAGAGAGAAAANTDYQALIDQAVASGNLADAAKYEQLRNAKIDSMNASNQNPNGYTKTYLYQSYLSGGNTQPVVPTTPPTEYVPITPKPITPGESALVRPSEGENRLTADDIKALYQQMQDQQTQKIDYTVQKAVDELNRAQEDAQKGFASQRNKVNIEEAQARDAQVLYAAARGDRGGITGRQYDSIANTAANNRAAINQAQQQLATDTARQIADLRAQGEFEKADALLQIAQQQLAKLWELQQYNDNLILQEQQQAMQESDITGSYNGKPTLGFQIADREFDYNTQMAEREWQQALKEWDYNTAQQEREWAYEIAMQSIQAGIVPDASTLTAAGIDPSTANQMASIYKASMEAKKTSGGGGGGSGSGSGKGDDGKVTLTVAQNMAEAGQFTPAVLQAFYDAGYTDEYLAEMYGYEVTPDISTYRITNEMPDDTSIVVPGFGRMLFEGINSVSALMSKGSVERVVDHDKKTITYQRVW